MRPTFPFLVATAALTIHMGAAHAGQCHTECDDGAVASCVNLWTSAANGASAQLSTAIAHRDSLPGQIQRCQSDRDGYLRTRDEQARASANDNGKASQAGKDEAALASLLDLVKSKHALLASMRPWVEASAPALVQSVRDYLDGRELTLKLQMADLLDRIDQIDQSSAGAPDSRQLVFDLETLNELTAMTHLAGGTDKIDALLGALLDPSGKSAIEPGAVLTRALLEWARTEAPHYQDGSRAFAQLEQGFIEIENKLAENLQAARTDLNQATASGTTENQASIQAAAQAQAASASCQDLLNQLNGAVPAEIASAQSALNNAISQRSQCGGRYCRRICDGNDHGGGMGRF